MNIILDINLSPIWVDWLSRRGHTAIHWSEVGDPRAPDTEILEWAKNHDHLIFTHDLDFSRLLALTHTQGPSVLQVRTEDVLPSGIGNLVMNALDQFSDLIESGAIVVIDATSSRARVLPI